jgi:hypothetical protein
VSYDEVGSGLFVFRFWPWDPEETSVKQLLIAL